MDEDQLVDGAGKFWGDPPEPPNKGFFRPVDRDQRLNQRSKEWDITERVVLENEETVEAHRALDTCEDTACEYHHDSDCMCIHCDNAGVNGFSDPHEDHPLCDGCERCLECEDCECDEDCDCESCDR